MKLFFSLLFLSFLPFQSQAQVLMEYPVYQNMDQFNWHAFTNEENIQKHIDFTNETFKDLGAKSFTITSLNIDKLQLLRIEQELDLYRQGIKEGLSVDIGDVEEAIHRHWDNILNIEQQIQAQAGLTQEFFESAGIVATPGYIETDRMEAKELLESAGIIATPEYIESYRSGVKGLYKGDHEVMFNIVEKKDQNLYNSLGQNDELFAKFALPQVKRYTVKIGNVAKVYHNTLSSLDQNLSFAFDEDNIDTLIRIYYDSLEIYNCFQKNFPNPEGKSQQELKVVIEDWHEQQSKWGAKALMKAYQYGIRDNPWEVSRSLHDFQTAPLDIKTEMGTFYREEFLDNSAFIDTNDPYKQRARVNALIGLQYLGFLEGDEIELFNRAIEEGVIKRSGTDFFSGSLRPLPILP